MFIWNQESNSYVDFETGIELSPIPTHPNYFYGSDGHTYSNNFRWKKEGDSVRKLKRGIPNKNHKLDSSIELKSIIDFPRYFAGSDGHIYSKNYLLNKRDCELRKLKHGKTKKNSYYQVTLKKDGRQFTKKIHVLICTAFHGCKPKGMECSHINDDKENNRPENLMWENHIDNMKKSFINGRSSHGCTMFNSKLSMENLKEVINLLEKGVKHIDIAKRFNCSRYVITDFNRGKTYKIEKESCI